MNEELVEILKDICSELAWANALKCYELKMNARNPNETYGSYFLNDEVTRVANEYLNSINFETQ